MKNLDSPYALDKRQPDMWVKLKPDYIQGLGENLDLIILGPDRDDLSFFVFLFSAKTFLFESTFFCQ